MERFTPQTAPQYERHYDEDSFWKKVRHIASQVGAKVLFPALQLYFLLQAKEVPMKAKTLIIGALGYLVLPTDLVPDFIPVIGYLDDIVILSALISLAVGMIPDEIMQECRTQAENDRRTGEKKWVYAVPTIIIWMIILMIIIGIVINAG